MLSATVLASKSCAVLSTAHGFIIQSRISESMLKTMKIIKLLSIVLAILGVSYLVFGLFLSSGLARTCRVDQLVAVVSPNTRIVAKLQVERCSYETDAMVVLDISEKETPNKSTSSKLGVATTSDIEVRWLSDHRLQVLYPNTFKPAQSQLSVGGMEIELVGK